MPPLNPGVAQLRDLTVAALYLCAATIAVAITIRVLLVTGIACWRAASRHDPKQFVSGDGVTVTAGEFIAEGEAVYVRAGKVYGVPVDAG